MELDRRRCRQTHARAIVSLSRGGSDAVTLREFDIDAKAFVTDGFMLPEAKGGVDWIDADTLLLSSAYGEGMATTSGYARTVRLMAARRARAISAPVIFEAPRRPHGRVLRCRPTPDLYRGSGSSIGSISSTSNIWLGDETGAEMQTRPADRHLDGGPSRLARGQAARPRGRSAAGPIAPDTVLGISLVGLPGRRPRFHGRVRAGATAGAAGLLLGRRQARAVDPRRIAAGVRDLHAVGQRLDPRQTAADFPRSASSMSGVSIVDESESNGDLLANIQDPLTPPSLMLIEGLQQPDIAEAGAARHSPPTASSSRSTRRSRSTANAFPMCRPGLPPRPAMRRSI